MKYNIKECFKISVKLVNKQAGTFVTYFMIKNIVTIV